MYKIALNWKERLIIALMLFGLFFGAGNIIFPVFLGQQAAGNVGLAITGFNITAVGLPLLAIAAMGFSETESVFQIANKVNRPFAYFFTIALYLTIGPLFATPRLATVSYEVGITDFVPDHWESPALFLYSAFFFLLVLYFSLRSSKIIAWVGKYLTPAFLILLAVILVRALFDTGGFRQGLLPSPAYQVAPLTTGLLEGYNTMDSLAGLAFGIIIIRSIREFGIQQPRQVTREVMLSGSLSILLMALIYIALALLGSHSLQFIAPAENGGQALSLITRHYFGLAGQILLAVMITVACLKTAIGLVVALAETFAKFHFFNLNQKQWTIIACLLAFLVANIGFEAILSLSLPVLMLLYPLACVLILLSLLPQNWQSSALYQITMAVTFVPACLDFIKASPDFISQSGLGSSLTQWASHYLPFFDLGFAWLIPATVTMVLCLLVQKMKSKP
ncbi:branched-chain amino acid transport system II carrier protein [Aerococcus urinae]